MRIYNDQGLKVSAGSYDPMMTPVWQGLHTFNAGIAIPPGLAPCIVPENLTQKFTRTPMVTLTGASTVVTTSIPSWARKIRVNCVELRTVSDAIAVIQLRRAGVWQSANYACEAAAVATGANNTTVGSHGITYGVPVSALIGGGTGIVTGTVTLEHMLGTEVWVCSGVTANHAGNVAMVGGYVVIPGVAIEGVMIALTAGSFGVNSAASVSYE